MNDSIFLKIADKLKNCILSGDKNLWSQLFIISDDVASQSMYKWFEDYFVVHRVKKCEIVLDNINTSPQKNEFACFIKAEYPEYDDFTDHYLIKIEPHTLKIVCIEQIYLPDSKNNLSWYTNLQEKISWWESPLAKGRISQQDSLPYKKLARAITRNIRFREAHIQLECASLLVCMMSTVIFNIFKQLNLPQDNSEEKIKFIYNVIRNKFCLQIIRPDRDNTWASKYLAPWYGIEEILIGHEAEKRIPVSCNVFMTVLYSLLRWSGFQASQLVQFRIINQDYLIICNDDGKLYFVSHDNFILCTERTIYPSGKINKVFGAEWFIDFQHNSAVASAELIYKYNSIAQRTFLPEYNLTDEVKEEPFVEPKLPFYEFRNSIFNCGLTDSNIFMWAQYANQTLFVSQPEAYVYWSVQSNWGPVVFHSEEEIFHYIKNMKKESIFPEADRIMTADQCIRHQMGSTKDIAIFLYAALKKFFNVEGCIIFTPKYEYCVYRYHTSDEWVIYNVCHQTVEETIYDEILLSFNDRNSYYPFRKPSDTNPIYFEKSKLKNIIQ